MGATTSKENNPGPKNFPDCLSYNGIEICESKNYLIRGENAGGSGTSYLSAEGAASDGDTFNFFRVVGWPKGFLPPGNDGVFKFQHTGNGTVHILKNGKLLYNGYGIGGTAPITVCSGIDSVAPGGNTTVLDPFCDSVYRDFSGVPISGDPLPIELGFRNLKGGKFNILVRQNFDPNYKLNIMAKRDRQTSGVQSNVLAGEDTGVGPNGNTFNTFDEFVWRLIEQ